MIPAATQSAPVVRGRSVRRPFQDQATSLLDLFDLSFTRYVTPLIVKITWVLALALAAVWLLTVIVGLIISSLPEVEVSQRTEQPAPTLPSRPTRPAEPAQPHWEFGPPRIVERAGDASYDAALKVVIVITQVVAIVLFLLWVRVALEAVIVIFHMAASLRSIDDKTPDGQS
jgi:hypothetical protein